MTAVPSAFPSPSDKSFSVVGYGRAGQSFARALQQRGWTLVGVHHRGDDASAAAAHVRLVLLCVPDAAIAEVATAIAPGRAVVAHVAGSLGLEVLEPHTNRASIHPLMSLPDPERGSGRLLDRCTFAVDGDPVVAAVVDDLGGVRVHISDDQRPLYHATACVAANHLTALCGQVEGLAALVGVPVDAYWKLMTTTLSNITEIGVGPALTGPSARGDWSTIARHLDVLPAEERPLYVALGRRAAEIGGGRWPEEFR